MTHSTNSASLLEVLSIYLATVLTKFFLSGQVFYYFTLATVRPDDFTDQRETSKKKRVKMFLS